MSKTFLVRQRNCIASSCASHWRTKNAPEMEEVFIEDVPDVAVIYAVERVPALVSIDDYGVVVERVFGFNERKYSELLESNKRETIV